MEAAPGKGAQSSSCSWRKSLHQPQGFACGSAHCFWRRFLRSCVASDSRIASWGNQVLQLLWRGTAFGLGWLEIVHFLIFPMKMSLQPDLKHSVQCPPRVSGSSFGGCYFRFFPFCVPPPDISFWTHWYAVLQHVWFLPASFLGKTAHQTTRICSLHLPLAGPWAVGVAAGCWSPKNRSWGLTVSQCQEYLSGFGKYMQRGHRCSFYVVLL